MTFTAVTVSVTSYWGESTIAWEVFPARAGHDKPPLPVASITLLAADPASLHGPACRWEPVHPQGGGLCRPDRPGQRHSGDDEPAESHADLPLEEADDRRDHHADQGHADQHRRVIPELVARRFLQRGEIGVGHNRYHQVHRLRDRHQDEPGDDDGTRKPRPRATVCGIGIRRSAHGSPPHRLFRGRPGGASASEVSAERSRRRAPSRYDDSPGGAKRGSQRFSGERRDGVTKPKTDSGNPLPSRLRKPTPLQVGRWESRP